MEIIGYICIFMHAYTHIHNMYVCVCETIIINEKEAINLRAEYRRSLRGDLGGAIGSKF